MGLACPAPPWQVIISGIGGRDGSAVRDEADHFEAARAAAAGQFRPLAPQLLESHGSATPSAHGF